MKDSESLAQGITTRVSVTTGFLKQHVFITLYLFSFYPCQHLPYHLAEKTHPCGFIWASSNATSWGTKTKQHTASSFRDTRCHKETPCCLVFTPIVMGECLDICKGCSLATLHGCKKYTFCSKKCFKHHNYSLPIPQILIISILNRCVCYTILLPYMSFICTNLRT